MDQLCPHIPTLLDEFPRTSGFPSGASDPCWREGTEVSVGLATAYISSVSTHCYQPPGCQESPTSTLQTLRLSSQVDISELFIISCRVK